MPSRRCEVCNYETSRKHCFDSHMKSAKHMKNVENPPVHKEFNEFKYVCEVCRYGCDNATTLNTHLQTNKHAVAMKESVFICSCGERFRSDAVLKKHLETSGHASPHSISLTSENIDEIVANRVKGELESKLSDILSAQTAQTTILTDTLKALIEKESKNNIYNDHSTQHNQFNINLFMTENCKDAMNLTEFSDSIKVLRTDIDRLNITGNPDSTAEIIGRELSKLAVNERPIHCTDLKRNTVYIKEDGLWTKEGSEEKLKVLAVQTFRKHAGAYKETMNDYRSGGDTSYWCQRAKHIDEGNFCRKMKSKHVSSRVYNTICDAAVLNDAVAQDAMKLS